MKTYLDLGAVLSLLLPGTETETVFSLVSALDPPFRLNAVHCLQVENGLFRARFQHFLSLHPANRTVAEAAGLKLLPETL